jgi:hypothetical protein
VHLLIRLSYHTYTLCDDVPAMYMDVPAMYMDVPAMYMDTGISHVSIYYPGGGFMAFSILFPIAFAFVSTSCSRAEVDSIYLFSGITIIF